MLVYVLYKERRFYMKAKNDKHVDLCQLYEKMDEKEQETLINVAGKLFEVQLSISNDKSGLLVEADQAGTAMCL